jgi:hemerythrin
MKKIRFKFITKYVLQHWEFTVTYLSKVAQKQRLSKDGTTQTTIGETMMEYVNTWLHSNIKSNDEKLLNYTNEACFNKVFLK